MGTSPKIAAGNRRCAFRRRSEAMAGQVSFGLRGRFAAPRLRRGIISRACAILDVTPNHTQMRNKHSKAWRWYFTMSVMRWIAKWCPWYIRLVAGPHADEVFRQIKDSEGNSRHG
jgi:hypothetical protein